MNEEEKPKRVSGKKWDGSLYETGSHACVIMILSGSEGGLRHVGKCAQYLSDKGIPALALGYFKTKHTKKALDRIPVEIIKEAVEYLKACGYEKIGIEGISKGAELALAAAIAYPVFFTVIIKTPSWFYSEGLVSHQPSGHSCWTQSGQEIPYTPYLIRHFQMIKMLVAAKEFNILQVNKGKKVTAESVIPVEKIKAPILMFSTKADTIWPSEESCQKIMNRLEDHHFPYPYRHVSYHHMSHMMIEYFAKYVKYFFKSERIDPEACFKERADMGQEAVNWIKEMADH